LIRIGCRVVVAENCSSRVSSSFTGARDDVLDQHLLLAAEPAAQPPGFDIHLGGRQIEQRAQRPAGQKRGLGRGTQAKPPRIVKPPDCRMGLERHMLSALRLKAGLIGDVRRFQRGRHIPGFAVDFGQEIGQPPRAGLARVEFRRPRLHRRHRIEHCREHFVIYAQQTAPRVGRRFAFGYDRRDTLADKAHGVVEHPRIQRVVGVPLMPRGREPPRWRVVMSEHGVHPGEREGGGTVDRNDPGMGMRRAQQFHI
jgi:hypothetical protein